jgi:hypothetical protein
MFSGECLAVPAVYDLVTTCTIHGDKWPCFVTAVKGWHDISGSKRPWTRHRQHFNHRLLGQVDCQALDALCGIAHPASALSKDWRHTLAVRFMGSNKILHKHRFMGKSTHPG